MVNYFPVKSACGGLNVNNTPRIGVNKMSHTHTIRLWWIECFTVNIFHQTQSDVHSEVQYTPP